MIPITNRDNQIVGNLRLITASEAALPDVVACMTDWRNANRQFFLTQFTATPARTARWLSGVILSDKTRSMYLVEDAEGRAIGQVGVKCLGTECPELDNMIRGRPGGDPQLMFFAELAVLRFLFANRSVRSVCLWVFSRNWIPIGIHQSIGFRPERLEPLFRVEHGDEVQLISGGPDGKPEKFDYLRMEIDRLTFEEHIRKFVCDQTL